MIKQQNYTKVAEYTKKAFQVFTKRTLAAQLIEILAHPKQKKEAPLSNETDLYADNDNALSDTQQRKTLEEVENKNANMRTFNQQTRNDVKEAIACVKIGKVGYGDVVCFQMRQQSENCRMAVMLDGVKLYTQKQMPGNSLTAKKMCFQVCCPSAQFGQKGKPITSESMVCFRSVHTGQYIKTTQNLVSACQLGYQVAFSAEISKQCLYRLVSTNSRSRQVSSDHDVCVSSYYTPSLYWSVDQSSMQTVVDRVLISAFAPTWFRIAISNFSSIKNFPYYYVQCTGISKRVRGEYVPFSNLTIRKEYRQLDYEDTAQKIQSLNFNEACSFYQLGDMRFSKDVQIGPIDPASLYQLWEVDRVRVTDQGFKCKITNVVTSQSIVPGGSQGEQAQNILHLKRQPSQGDQYLILNSQNTNLCALYEGEGERYALKFEQDLSLKSASVNKNCIVEFQLIQFEASKCECLVELLQCYELLKNGFHFIQKWGFRYEEQECRMTYSMTELKTHLTLLRRKMRQLMAVLQKLKQLIETSESDSSGVKDMSRQLKIFQLLILYCKAINAKIDSPKHRNSEIYQLAEQELKPFQNNLFQILYLLIYNNKGNSEVIIDHSIFFNHLLSLYPETIGALLEESIKNLCLLTTKISKEELVLFEWTRLVDYLTAEDKLDIQRKYVDIISEVAIDPTDIGITPYQNKIKEQLFSRTKKKIFPKYILDDEIGPLIMFEYSDFPIQIEVIGVGKCFELASLFMGRECRMQYVSHVDYINSLLKLFRNLCKDRNRKMPKIVEDYGLTQQFMHAVFRNSSIGWEQVAMFIDLYCSMYLIQDPFVSFEKKEVKCFAWEKIASIDFGKKTGILFKQFTEEHLAQDKLKQFDIHIWPLLDQYFQELSLTFQQKKDEKIHSMKLEERHGGVNSFMVFVSVVEQIVNYGYLSLNIINRYLVIILKQADISFAGEENSEKKRKLLQKVVKLCKMTQEINTIIHSANLLKKIYINFKAPMQPSRQKIANTFAKALSTHPKILEEDQTRKRRFSMKSNKNTQQKQSYESYLEEKDGEELDLIKFTLNMIVQSRYQGCNIGLKKLFDLLELISRRGERICVFLTDVLIFNTVEEENLYLEYSGITPLGFVGDTASSSRRLLNVMKVKELIDKITEESVDSGDEERKKQKIYQLNNLLSKILTNLEHLKNKNYRLFGVCQTLLQKLKMHSILGLVMKFHEHDSYQQLIGQIVRFFCEFVQGNEENLNVMTDFFPALTKKYSYRRLPYLLKMLFSYVSDPESAFEMVFDNIGKKMKQGHRQIFFSCLYKILKICSASLLDKIKGKVIYTLTSLQHFGAYVTGEQISINFINLLCFVGQGITGVHQKIKQVVKRSQLLQVLQNQKSSYELKWIYLKVYHFLYVEGQSKFDEIEVSLIIENIFLNQLRNLPPTCRVGALAVMKETQLEDDLSKNDSRLKDSIQQQYNKLIAHARDVLHPTNEESYFNYLLNIDEETEFSMLVCLQALIGKFKIPCIEPLADYVFQLINFMDKIYVKEQTYQGRILSKLYEISQILNQKYNQMNGYERRLKYSEAYPIVEKFFRRIAGIVQKEGISYAKILQCAQVTHAEIGKARSQSGGSKLILQSSFFKFVYDLSRLVNSRAQFMELSDGTIKEFFFQFKQKNNHKLNILGFLMKLLDVLQFQKNAKVVHQNNQNRRSEDTLEWQKQGSTSFVNRELIKNQIQSYRNTYEMLLQDTMIDNIKAQLSSLLEIKMKEECSHGARSILQMHSIGSEYKITNLVVSGILAKWTVEESLVKLTVKDIDKYLNFCLKSLSKELNKNMVNSLCHLYDKIKQKPQMMNLFCTFVLSLNDLISKVITSTKTSEIFQILQHFYHLVELMSQNPFFSQINNKLQESAVNLFSFCFVKMNEAEDSSTYWIGCCELLLNSIIVSFDDGRTIAKKLAEGKVFREGIVRYLNMRLSKKILSTNSTFYKHFGIINKVFLLLIKLTTQGYRREVGQIVHTWPFDFLFELVQENYLPMLEDKEIKREKCELEAGCSLEFCNNGKMTPYDLEKVETLMNILTIVFISADLMLMGQMNPVASPILNSYNSWKKGSKEALPSNSLKLFGTVHRVDIKQSSATSQIYFSLPFLDKICKPCFQTQLDEQIKLFKKQRFFDNIYKLSFFVEKELENHESTSYEFVVNNFQIVSEYLQVLFLIYLIVVCSMYLYLDLHQKDSEGLLNILNGIILVIKIGLFGWEIKRFFSQRRMLFYIQYKQQTLFWKYSRVVTSIVILVCYCLQFVFSSIYPVTLLLELYRVKMFEEIVNYSISAFKMLIYAIIPLEIITLMASFLIVKNGYPDNVFNVFFQIQYEATLLTKVTLMAEDQSSYPLLRTVPLIIPAYIILGTTNKVIFISCIINAIIKRKAIQNNEGQVCSICRGSRKAFQARGINFQNHIAREHSIWGYIYFFIFMRRGRSEHLIDRKIKEMIEKQDFQFMKLDCWK